MATICPYCGEAISITSKSAGNFRPERCIPFSKSKEEIIKLYKNYISKTVLAPKKFKEQHVVEKIQGLFAPFYLHSMDVDSSHIFNGEQISSRVSGDYKVTTHRVYNLKVNSTGSFRDVPTDASERLDNALMDSLEPFDYKDCKDYNPAYMAGFSAEQADVKKEELSARAEKRVSDGMSKKARETCNGYSAVSTISENNCITNHVTEYVMLPVWLLHIVHNDKKYTFAVNGQTGKVVGKVPIDFKKLIGTGVGIAFLCDLVLGLLKAVF